MEFRILGPLEVVDEGEPLALGTLKERTVLATFLLHTKEVVPRARLIDELWGRVTACGGQEGGQRLPLAAA